MRTIRSLALAAALVAGTASAQAPHEAKTPPKAPANPDHALKLIGLSIAQSLQPFQLTPQELDKVVAGIKEGIGKPGQLEPGAQQELQEFVRWRSYQKNSAAGDAAIAKAAKQPGAVKTESGAIVIPVKAGAGAAPTASDKVKVHYVGTLLDGKEFDSSVKRGEPAEFPLSGVIKCWTEGLQKMKVGGKAKLVCPSDLAYGDRGTPGIPPYSVLNFEVELLDIVK